MPYKKLNMTINIMLVISLVMLAGATYYGLNKWEAEQARSDV